MKQFKFQDSVLLDQPMLQDNKDEALQILNRDRKPKLRVLIDTTHSGVLTNGRVYPAKHVSIGYRTFFSKDKGGSAEFDKPVLKHHSMYDDPIGRVTRATFTPLKHGESLEKDFLSPDPIGSRGSGVVTAEAVIVDPDSIEKILDGRYLSVSAGHGTDSMTCSICGKSIFKCTHIPGKSYDEEGEATSDDEGFLCFFITGDMTYHEISFVNMPAQPPAKLINFRWDDTIKQDFEKNNDIIIKSLTRGKKGTVKSLVLVDDDGEFNLLSNTGRQSKEKVSVSMQNSEPDLNQKIDTEVVDKTSKVDDNKNKEAANVEKHTIINRETQEEDILMADNKTDTAALGSKELVASLEALTKENTTLKAQVATSSTEIEALKKSEANKDAEIKRLVDEGTKIRTDMSAHLATALASFRIRLNKSDTADLYDPKVGTLDRVKFDGYVAKLAKRTSESLKDSLEDLVAELKEVKETSNVTTIVKDTKVDSVVLARGTKPSETKDKKDKDPLDNELD